MTKPSRLGPGVNKIDSGAAKIEGLGASKDDFGGSKIDQTRRSYFKNANVQQSYDFVPKNIFFIAKMSQTQAALKRRGSR